MSKVFITGSGGVGKSTVIKNLVERGFTAYDTDDMPGVTRLEDKEGNPKEWPTGYIDWSKYQWNWQRPEIEKLLMSDETVFMGAMPSNWREFVGDFDTTIAVTVNSQVHEQRLKTRNVHEHGQGKRNIADNIYSQEQNLGKFVAAGAIVVDNDRPIDEVVDEILAISHVDR